MGKQSEKCRFLMMKTNGNANSKSRNKVNTYPNNIFARTRNNCSRTWSMFQCIESTDATLSLRSSLAHMSHGPWQATVSAVPLAPANVVVVVAHAIARPRGPRASCVALTDTHIHTERGEVFVFGLMMLDMRHPFCCSSAQFA